ncbi:MAG: hypothetical protein H6728_16550 [Myxococcales bacterium]|nr:hypothetical protein [Myxococcales bacterium]
MEVQKIMADIVVLAEREVIVSQAMGTALLARVDHEPLHEVGEGGVLHAEGMRIEAYRLLLPSSPWGERVIFAWFQGGHEDANLRFAEDLDVFFDAKRYLTLYRHRSNQSLRRLTIHPVGNFATPPSPDYGEPHSLAFADPLLMSAGLRCLRDVVQDRGLEDVEVSFEITHHNPTGLQAPIHFLEIGDGPEQWEDHTLVDAAIEAVVRCLSQPLPTPRYRCVGVSYGDHYALSFTKLALEGDLCFGHLIPTHALPSMKLEDFQQAVEKTVGGVDAILYKRLKGLSAFERKRLEGYCQKQGIRLQKYDQPLE